MNSVGDLRDWRVDDGYVGWNACRYSSAWWCEFVHEFAEEALAIRNCMKSHNNWLWIKCWPVEIYREIHIAQIEIPSRPFVIILQRNNTTSWHALIVPMRWEVMKIAANFLRHSLTNIQPIASKIPSRVFLFDVVTFPILFPSESEWNQFDSVAKIITIIKYN